MRIKFRYQSSTSSHFALKNISQTEKAVDIGAYEPFHSEILYHLDSAFSTGTVTTGLSPIFKARRAKRRSSKL